jgi:hypothetical protein
VLAESRAVDEWLSRARDALADEAGADPSSLQLDEAAAGDVLDMARIAAHVSGDRRNAPLLCYLAGAASRGADVAALAERIRRLDSGRRAPD